jgi:hypothetical protein
MRKTQIRIVYYGAIWRVNDTIDRIIQEAQELSRLITAGEENHWLGAKFMPPF